MSFSAQVKAELIRADNDADCCRRAELAAMVHVSGSIMKSSGSLQLIISTESAATARRLFMLWKDLFGFIPQVMFRRQRQLRKSKVFLVVLRGEQDVRRALAELHLARMPGEWVPHLVNSDCCRRAYLRGAFLAGGSLTNPEVSYHLEFVVPYFAYARVLAEIMARYNLPARIFRRKQCHVVYLKDSEAISDFLRLAGASATLFKLENTRILKGLRSQINRLVNCDTANMDKTVQAARRQIENINLIERTVGLGRLSPSLRRAAELRRRYPEATLAELGAMSDPPLGKSGINHRLRRIDRIARRLAGGENVLK